MTMRTADDVAERISAVTRRDLALIAARRGEPMEPTPDLLRALVDVTQALTEAGVPYALIGGLAVGIQSEQPRATLDVDLAVSTQTARARVVELLAANGVRVTGEFDHSVNFVALDGTPVQVAFDPSFDEMLARAEEVTIGGAVIRVLTVADLIASKERAASDPARRRSKALRDQADVELLKGDVPNDDEGW
jgi:predicted nucleotidyltransferase